MNRCVCKSPSFDRYFYVGDVKSKIAGLFSPPRPRFHSLAQQSGHFVPTKQAWQKLLIAWNKLVIDRGGDQSLYLRAALPVTGGFHRAVSVPAPATFTQDSKVFPGTGQVLGGNPAQVGRSRGLCRLPSAPRSHRRCPRLCVTQEPFGRDVGCPGSPSGRLGALRPLWHHGGIIPLAGARGSGRGTELGMLGKRSQARGVVSGAVRELGSTSPNSGYSGIP